MKYLVLILLFSCSSVTYTGEGDKTIHISKHANQKVITLKGDHEVQNIFYGALPKTHHIKLGNDFYRKKGEYVSRVEITEIETPLDQLIKFISLGLFSTKTISTRAVTDKGELDYEIID